MKQTFVTEYMECATSMRRNGVNMKIIIPAYEPDEKLISLISAIKENCDYGMVIVNDGSSPSCSDIFKKAGDLGCTILIHEQNRGKGAALKTAFSYLLNNHENEDIVCADCDGQHTWQDINKTAEAISLHKDSIILGCREFSGKIPLKSMLGNKITGFIYSLISKSTISDTQTGLRGFSAQMLPWLVSLKGERYEYEMNQLLEAKSAGYQLYSIPIQTIYENNNTGSHFHAVRDSIRIYLPILKFCLSSIGCGILDFIALFVLHALTGNLLISVVVARIISSLCNYFMNKNLVFNANSKKNYVFFLKYYALVVIVLACNYMMIRCFITIGLPLVIAKLITETILFISSYIIQHRFIFK